MLEELQNGLYQKAKENREAIPIPCVSGEVRSFTNSDVKVVKSWLTLNGIKLPGKIISLPVHNPCSKETHVIYVLVKNQGSFNAILLINLS